MKSLKQKHKFIIYFDYKVLSYIKSYDIHSLFIFKYDIKCRFKNRPTMLGDRSQTIKKFVKNIYHIDKFV